MILKFRLGGVKLSHDNNTLTVGDIFKIVSSDVINWDISNGVATASSKNKFTVDIILSQADNSVISFESEPEDTYGDNYSIDISNVSVLDFSDDYIGLVSSVEGVVEGLTIKFYKAVFTDCGIDLIDHDIDNTVIELDSCYLNSDTSNIHLGVNTLGSNNKISRTKIALRDCNIRSQHLLFIGVGENSGVISDSVISIANCRIVGKDDILIGIGVYGNSGEITNCSMCLDNCEITNEGSIYMNTSDNSGTITDIDISMKNTIINTACVYMGVSDYKNTGELTNISISIDNVIVNAGIVSVGIDLSVNSGEITNSFTTIRDSTIDNRSGLISNISSSVDTLDVNTDSKQPYSILYRFIDTPTNRNVTMKLHNTVINRLV